MLSVSQRLPWRTIQIDREIFSQNAHIAYVYEEIDYGRNCYNAYQADSFTSKLVLALADQSRPRFHLCYTSRFSTTWPGSETSSNMRST